MNIKYLFFIFLINIQIVHAGTGIQSEIVKFPIKTSLGGKHFLDANGQPYLVVADVAWQMLRKLDYANAVKYLDVRKSQSFNTILIQALPIQPNQKNFYKKAPFSADVNPKINPDYFSYLEKIVVAAKTRNMQIGIVVNRAGWNTILNESLIATYKKFLLEKLGKYSNVIWLVDHNSTNDYQEFLTPSGSRSLVASFYNNFESYTKNETNSRFDFDLIIPDSTSTEQDYAYFLDQFQKSTITTSKPLLLANTEIPKALVDASAMIRKQAYNMLSISGAGFCFQSTIKNFLPTWPVNITKDGAEFIQKAVEIMDQIPWPYMKADWNGEFYVKNPLSETQVNVELLANKRMAMLYLSNSEEIAVNLSFLVGEEFNVVWYSPRTGRRWRGGQFASDKVVKFMPPENNSEWDWILLIGATQ